MIQYLIIATFEHVFFCVILKDKKKSMGSKGDSHRIVTKYINIHTVTNVKQKTEEKKYNSFQ